MAEAKRNYLIRSVAIGRNITYWLGVGKSGRRYAWRPGPAGKAAAIRFADHQFARALLTKISGAGGGDAEVVGEDES